VDGLFIRLQVALRVGVGGSGLAQHVVAVAKALLFVGAAVGQGFSNVLAGDELLAHQLHGAVHTLADQRLAPLADHAGERGRQALSLLVEVSLPVSTRPQAAALTNSGRAADVRLPVALADLVADQGVARGAVRNAQQRFGQAHERHAFLAGERKLLHQRGHATARGRIAQALHQARGQFAHLAGLFGILGARQRQQRGQAFRLGAVPGRGDGGAQRRLWQDGLGEHQEGLRCFHRWGRGRIFCTVVLRWLSQAGEADGGGAALQRIDVL